jgi:predicted nucleic acid-binding protein
MKVLLDTCVLYPVLLREILMLAAENALFEPLWSPRIFEEWARRAAKDGPVDEMAVRGDQALLSARFPRAMVTVPPALQARLWLPDPDDIHVFAAAIAGHADVILTFNAQDFPRGTLRDEGLERQNPDEFLCQVRIEKPDGFARVLGALTARLPAGIDLRQALKRASLPRLGKAVSPRDRERSAPES